MNNDYDMVIKTGFCTLEQHLMHIHLKLLRTTINSLSLHEYDFHKQHRLSSEPRVHSVQNLNLVVYLYLS